MSSSQPAVFLDRDGTLIEDVGYISRPDQVQVLPGVPEALAALRRAGFLLIITTNQSGIGRGFYTEEAYARVTRAMVEELRVEFDAILHCPHTPMDECPCRKPGPGLLLKAARQFDIDFIRSWAVGDRERDIMAGLALGCRAVYLGRGPTPGEARHAPDFPAAAKIIIGARE